MSMRAVDLADPVRYPVGDFTIDPDVTPSKRRQWLRQMTDTPAVVAAAVRGLGEEQLSIPYRPNGWTPRQVVHHLADAHMNGFVRFKLALTEDRPAIKTYEEAAWAETADGRDAPVDASLRLLDALHQRWAILLESLPEGDFARAFAHPDRGVLSIDKAIQLYAWHGRHHAAQVAGLRERLAVSPRTS